MYVPISALGATRAITISTVAEKDTYVDIDSPLSNYGGQNWLIFGDYFFGFREAYLFFNFTDKPVGWTKAEISIDMYSVSETFDVTVSLINEDWNETDITWLNKPEHNQTITTFTVSAGNVYKFDVTSYIAGRNNISVCINASDYMQTGYVQASSREFYFFEEDAPQLIWTYNEEVDITVTSPKNSDNWKSGYHSITWTTVGNIDQVKIELYKGSTFVEDLSVFGYTNNDGEYDWYISISAEYSGSDYRIKITDYDDGTLYDYSDYFELMGEDTGSPNGTTLPSISGFQIMPVLLCVSIGIFALAFSIRKRRY